MNIEILENKIGLFKSIEKRKISFRSPIKIKIWLN